MMKSEIFVGLTILATVFVQITPMAAPTGTAFTFQAA
jgi:hypothetical protein